MLTFEHILKLILSDGMEFQWNNRYQKLRRVKGERGRKAERDKTTYIHLIVPCIFFDDRFIPLTQQSIRKSIIASKFLHHPKLVVDNPNPQSQSFKRSYHWKVF